MTDTATGLPQNGKTPAPKPRRRPTVEDIANWTRQSGMGLGARADALGDEPEEEDEDEVDEQTKQFGYQRDPDAGPLDEAAQKVETMKEHDRSIRGSVY